MTDRFHHAATRQAPAGSGRTDRELVAALTRLPPLAVALLLVLGLALLPPAAVAQEGAPELVPQPPVKCPVPVDPVPSGLSFEPGDSFSTQPEYRWVHSSTHLQGRPSRVKWAWGFYLPAPTSPAPLFNRFRTVVVVNNPDPANAIGFDIDYFDMGGNLLGTSTYNSVPPEGSIHELATPLRLGNGLGSIRVTAQDGSGPFVGATVHHSYHFDGVLDFEPRAPILPVFTQHPGLSSMQQLQDPRNGAPVVYGGPYPTTSDPNATHVFFRGNLPVFQVVNPNNAVVNATITFYGNFTGAAFSVPLTLQPFGSHIDMTLLNILYDPTTHAYFSPIHENWLVTVSSNSDLQLLGEQLLLDFYDHSMTPFTRFRMVSSMMATKPARILHNPELTYTQTGPPVHTLMAIGNVSGEDVGPVVIEYRDARNNLFATDTLSIFPPGYSVRIAPGEPGILNYPALVWDGNVRIRACKAGLVGWTAREVEPDPFSSDDQFRKAYGESLDGTNRTEPGDSFAVTTLGLNLRRKVAPLDRCALPNDSPSWWPSYTTFTQVSSPNLGDYYYRFFQFNGVEGSATSLPFQGLRPFHNSFTFEDGPNRTCQPPFVRETSGRVDHTFGSVKGIDVIGDPLFEWDLGVPAPPVDAEPGDLVPAEPVPVGGNGGPGTAAP